MSPAGISAGGLLAAVGIPLAALGALVVATTAMVATVSATGVVGPGGAGGPSGAGGPGVVAGIPGDFLLDVERAGARFGVPWAVLAGIYHQECDFGQSPLSGCNPAGSQNPFGAQGPGQFLPGTWRRGLGPRQPIPNGPPTTTVADGYATDGDGDGVADPWDPADATASTARMLAANGAASGDVTGAVFAYNHDPAYVEAVMASAASYEQAAGPSGPPGQSGSPGPAGATGAALVGLSGAVAGVIAFAQAHLGDPYQWGGSGPTVWDCSGLVQAAYRSAGLILTHDAAAQYQATAATRVPVAPGLRPGDLVFFGPSLVGIEHVGIVVGDGMMIDAPHTGAVVRVESYGWPDLIAATRPLP